MGSLGSKNFNTVIDLLCDWIEQTKDSDTRQFLTVELARLYAAAGQTDEAVAIVDRGFPIDAVKHWPGAVVYAEVISALLRVGDVYGACAVIERAVRSIEKSDVEKSAKDLAFYDLFWTLGRTEIAVSLLQLGLRSPLCAQDHNTLLSSMIDRRREAGDFEGALVLMNSAKKFKLDDDLVKDLLDLAVVQGCSEERFQDMRRLVTKLKGGEYEHWGIHYLLAIGDETEALSLLERLPPRAEDDHLVEALSMVACYFGIKGRQDEFERFADRCLAMAQVNVCFSFDKSLRRLAEGALGAFKGREDVLSWARVTLSDELMEIFTEELVYALDDRGDEPAARFIAKTLNDFTCPRLLAELDIRWSNRQILAAIKHSHFLADTDREEDALSAIASLKNRFLYISECIRIAEGAAAAGKEQVAALALKSAFAVLPGPPLYPVVNVDHKTWFDCGRNLGDAVRNTLPQEWCAAFADAALLHAAYNAHGDVSIAEVVPFALAAGYASIPEASSGL